MSKDVRPDDVVRSPTGRVPKWVLDEARGIPPTELVPFRAPTSTTASPRRRTKGRGKEALTIVLVLAIVGGVVAFQLTRPGGNAALFGSPHPPGSDSGYGPPPGHEEAGRKVGTLTTVASTDSMSFRFLRLQDDRATPVTWSPCRPIHYVVRPDHAPVEGPKLLTTAFAQLSAATGLVFVNDGGTSEAPSEDRPPYLKDRYGDRWAPVLIAWATPDEVPDFGVDIAGEAAPFPVGNDKGLRTFVSGEVMLDAAYLNSLIRAGHEPQVSAVVLHELGHLAGLAHVNDARQIMASRPAPGAPTAYAAGDITGLNLLGDGPCQPTV